MEIMETNEDDSAPKPFQCKYCPKSFLHGKSIKHHILNSHGKNKLKIKPLHCSECLKTKQVTKYFAKRYLLNSHIKEAHSKGRFECEICFKTFAFPSRFKTHQRIHSTEMDTRYKCDICSKVFSVQKSLTWHLFSKHDRKPEDVTYLKCDLCPQDFLKISHLERHVLAKHVVDKDFECDLCSKKFIDKETLNQHVKGHDTPTKYFCDVCFKGFRTIATLSVHLGVEHLKFFYCYKCNTSFTNKTEFDQHFNSKNGSDSKSEFKCRFCSKIMPTQCTLNIHTNSHPKPAIKIKQRAETSTENKTEEYLSDCEEETERPKSEIKCELCSKIFDRESYFRSHRKQVHQNADWPCNFQQCTRSFKIHTELRIHKMRHLAIRPFECSTCRKSFKVKKDLKKHQKTHLDENKFKCQMCTMTFVRPEAQRVHIANKHGGAKPFKCPVKNCGISFAANAYLNRHLVSHETIKSFKCDICTEPKEFNGLVHLNQHLRVVHLKKYADAIVFTCISQECSSFKTKSEKEVAVHYNDHHGLPKVKLFQNDILKIESNTLCSFSEKIRKHKTNKMILTRYKCKFCLKLFSLSWFEPHQDSCAVEPSFECSCCHKLFRFKNTLNKHIRLIHSKIN